MSIFRCYRGDWDHFALQEPGPSVIAAHDALGRPWLCVDTGLDVLPCGFPAEVAAMAEVHRLAQKQGLEWHGAEMLLLSAADADELKRQLVLKTYPPASTSIARLEQAGWSRKQWSERTCQLCRLTLTNGELTRTVEGEGTDEVWYLAAQQILDASPASQEIKTMTLTVQADPVPLRTDEHGVLRVGDSQVLLDTVIEEYRDGATPEEIVSAYDTLKLADVYAAIAYYLRHQDEVDGYLQARRAAVEKRWQEIEARQPDRANLRAKLLARRARMEQEHASPRE